MSEINLNTITVHAGQKADPETGSLAVPIYQTTSYAFKNTDHAARLFSLQEFGNIYTRLTNPTTDVLEKRVAAIEGGTCALAVASGQSAITYALLAVTGIGDEIVSGSNLYGGTYQLFNHTFPKTFGRTVKFVDAADLGAFERALTPKTKAFYVETIGNPKLDVPDFAAIAAIAHKAGIPLIVDNTIGVGLVRPIDHGADIVVCSATKYIGGHGTTLAGVITDSGRFQWNNGNFPEFTEPDPSYHGVVYWDVFGNVPGMGNIALVTKIRVTLLRDIGAALSPFSAQQLLLGTETLPLRQARHSENALAVAEWLSTHKAVNWVNYPGLKNSPYYAVAAKYLKKGFGGMVGFGIRGGLAAGKKFIDSLQLLSHVANIGDAKSLVIHPASTTHQQLTAEERVLTGATDDYVRLSIGIENVEDIIADLDQALAKSQ